MLERNKSIYSLLIIIQCAIFGVSFIALKVLLDGQMPPFFLISIRFFIGVLSLLLIRKSLSLFPRYAKHNGTNNRFTRREAILGLIAGGVIFVAYSLQTIGAQTTTPAKNGLFTDLFVIFVPLITMFFITKHFKIKPILLSLLAFIGVMIVLNIFTKENLSFVIGDLLSIFCGIGFALHFIVLEQAASEKINVMRLNPYNFTIIQLAIVALISIVISLCFEMKIYVNIEWHKAIGPLLFLGIASTAIAYLLQFIAQEKITAETTSLLSCSEAIFTLLFSLIFGFDKFNWLFVLGAGIIIVALIFSSVQFTKNVEYNSDGDI